MNVTTLPYLFSPANLASAGSFLAGFEAAPALGELRHPTVDPTASPVAAAATVLGSAIRLSTEGRTPPGNWRLMPCQPASVQRASEQFRFDDGVLPDPFGGEAAFENSLGQFVAVSWRTNDSLEVLVGWAWEGVTAMQTAVLAVADDERPLLSYMMQFEGRILASLKKFLNVASHGLEGVVEKLGDLVLSSGLIANPMKGDFVVIPQEGETNHFIPGRTDYLSGRFPKNVRVQIQGASVLVPDALTRSDRVQKELVALHVAMEPESENQALPPALMPLWDLAQTLAMGRMKSPAGLS